MARAWRRLQCFELFDLPLLDERQRKIVSEYDGKTIPAKQGRKAVTPSLAAAHLLELVYIRSIRVQDEAKKLLLQISDGNGLDDGLNYDAPITFDSDLLRYVVEEILFGAEVVTKGVVSAWLAAEEQGA